MGLNVIVVEGGNIKTPQSPLEQKFYNVRHNKYVNSKHKLLNGLELSHRDRSYTLGGSSECWSGYIIPLSEKVYSQKFSSWPLEWGSLNLTKYTERSLRIINSPIEKFDFCIVPENKKNLPSLLNGFNYNFGLFQLSLKTQKLWKPLVADSPNNLDKTHPVLCNYRPNDFRLDQDSLISKNLYFNPMANRI